IEQLAKALEMPAGSLLPVETDAIEIPILGRIAAGRHAVAHAVPEGKIALPLRELPTGELYALRVRGDSMINAGILSGDLAVFRATNSPFNGALVAATVGEETTLKRFSTIDGRDFLVAENPAFEPIPCTPEQTWVHGVVVM